MCVKTVADTWPDDNGKNFKGSGDTWNNEGFYERFAPLAPPGSFERRETPIELISKLRRDFHRKALKVALCSFMAGVGIGIGIEIHLEKIPEEVHPSNNVFWNNSSPFPVQNLKPED